MPGQLHSVLDAAVADLGGSARPGQLEMAEAIESAFAKDRHLLVQAGTGTGKSLGYLVPSLLHDERVVIATATLQLQHQLVGRDIPTLLRAAKSVVSKVGDVAVLKGRSNYACLHRVQEGAPDDQGVLVEVPTGSVGAEVVRLRSWATQQVEDNLPGDRDDAPSHGEQAWAQVSVSARECLGPNRCSYAKDCFAEKARDRAHQAQVVVTNHALLAIDAITDVPTLPDYSYLVIDEAHELTSRVTGAATIELGPGAIERLARRATNHVADLDAIDQLTESADAFNECLSEQSAGRIEQLPPPLQVALSQVRDAARACLSSLGAASTDSADAAKAQVRTAAEEIRVAAERMVGLSDADVLYATDSTAGPRLRLAPLDVAGALRSRLFAERTVVLTSATLTVGGSFDSIAGSCGLSVAEPDWTGLDVGSPFDYAKQGILYVAQHLGPPTQAGLSDDHLAEIASLIAAAGGRTLGLFSSRRAAEAAAEYVRGSLPEQEVLCQGDAQLAELTQRFAKEPRTSLFGTLSLWQGVDVPGSTCNLVIIDRIPFPRPDDPIMSARQQLIAQRGGNGFMQVAAQHAALLLAQGAGRLIRRTSDRGVVAVLDSRLRTARYGSFLTSTLPPLWRTTDRKVALSALRRLDEAGL